MLEKDFWVECSGCGQSLKNHAGSTPCCGALAYIINEDGTTSSEMSLFGKVIKEEE